MSCKKCFDWYNVHREMIYAETIYMETNCEGFVNFLKRGVEHGRKREAGASEERRESLPPR